jgi:hypothetical protein
MSDQTTEMDVMEVNMIQRELIDSLRAENNELRGLVEEAYLEGFDDGSVAPNNGRDAGWKCSLAKQTLEGIS